MIGAAGSLPEAVSGNLVAPRHPSERSPLFDLFSTPGVSALLYIVAIVAFSAYTIAHTKNRTRALNLEIVLMFSIGIIGFSGISNFVIHAFFGEAIAERIGWPAGNLFQLEVAGANLAIGLIGFLGFWRRDFWLPFLVAKALFSWTAGAAHIVDLASRQNAAIGNAGPILYLDFLVPAVLLVIYAVYARALHEPGGIVRIQPLSTRMR